MDAVVALVAPGILSSQTRTATVPSQRFLKEDTVRMLWVPWLRYFPQVQTVEARGAQPGSWGSTV